MGWESRVVAFIGDDERRHLAQGAVLANLFGVVPMWPVADGYTTKPHKAPAPWWTVVHIPTEHMMAHFPGDLFARSFCEVLAETPNCWRFPVWRGTDDEKLALCRQWSEAAERFGAFGT